MSIFENTILVDKKVSAGNKIGQVVCILLMGILLIGSFIIHPLFMTPAIILAIVWYLLYLNAQLEYEYTYIEGRLSVARIKAKRKRKELVRVEMEEVLVVAPSGHAELKTYDNNRQVTRKDCSSGFDVKTYQVVYKSGEGLLMMEFEPDEKMLDTMKSRYGRKVIIE